MAIRLGKKPYEKTSKRVLSVPGGKRTRSFHETIACSSQWEKSQGRRELPSYLEITQSEGVDTRGRSGEEDEKGSDYYLEG